VTFENCTFSGTVYVESDVTVLFRSCDVERVVLDVDSVKRGSITLSGGSYVNRVEMLRSGGIYTNDGCGVGDLYVSANAPGSGFSGSGTLGGVEIYADGFSSSSKPGYAEMERGLSCILGETMYNEYNIDQLHEELNLAGDDTGFLVPPYSDRVDGAECISFIPAYDGRVYHATSTSPNTAIGVTLSNGSIYRTVQAGVKSSIIIDRNLNFGLIKYYILEFADDSGKLYKPVSVPVSEPVPDYSANGFTGTLQLTSVMGYDTLSFVPAFEGQLFWFHTGTSVIMSREYFKSEADNIRAWGNVDPSKYPYVMPGVPMTVQLGLTIPSWSAVAVALLLPSGEYTEPVIVNRDGSIGGIGGTGGDAYSFMSPPVPNAPPGFKDVPIARWNGVNDSVMFTPRYNGTVKIEYYSDASLTSPPYYTNDCIVHESIKFNLEMPRTANLTQYPTVMITLTDKSGVVYGPYNVTRYNSDGSLIIKPTVQP